MIKYAKKEVLNRDTKSATLMNIYRAFYTKGEKNRLYIKRRASYDSQRGSTTNKKY